MNMPARQRKSPQHKEPKKSKTVKRLPIKGKEIRVIINGRVRKAVVTGITMRKREPIIHVRTTTDNRMHHFPLSKFNLKKPKKPKSRLMSPAEKRFELKRMKAKQKVAAEDAVRVARWELTRTGKLSEKTMQKLKSAKIRSSKIKPLPLYDRF